MLFQFQQVSPNKTEQDYFCRHEQIILLLNVSLGFTLSLLWMMGLILILPHAKKYFQMVSAFMITPVSFNFTYLLAMVLMRQKLKIKWSH